MSDPIDKNQESEDSNHSLRMKIALEVSKTGTFFWDIRKAKLEWDRSLLSLFEIPDSVSIQVLEDFLVHVLPEDRQKVEDHIDRVLEHGVETYEVRVKTATGEIKWLRDSAKTLYDESGEAYAMVGACTDITDLKNRIRQCELAQEEAERVNASKSEFVANVSHDMRTPLTAILGFTDVLRESIHDDTERGYLDVIERNTSSLLKLIDDVLDVSKIEAGEDRVVNEPVILQKMFSNIYESLSKDLKKHEIIMSFDIDNQIPETIYIDLQRLRRIIINLLSNAIRYTPEGTVKIKVNQMLMPDSSRKLVVQVIDSGEGILADDKKKIFKPFSSNNTLKVDHKGTGLGLYISRKLANSLDGTLELTSSERGVGSVFELQVPFGVTNTTTSTRKRSPATFHEFPGRTALIVEDNADNRLLINTKLGNWKLTCTVVGDGRAALKELKDKVYDVVFMDIRIPLIDGIAVTKKLRKMNYKGIIIAMTANAFDQERDLCLAAGCDRYFSKPIEFEELNSELYGLLK